MARTVCAFLQKGAQASVSEERTNNQRRAHRTYALLSFLSVCNPSDSLATAFEGCDGPCHNIYRGVCIPNMLSDKHFQVCPRAPNRIEEILVGKIVVPRKVSPSEVTILWQSNLDTIPMCIKIPGFDASSCFDKLSIEVRDKTTKSEKRKRLVN